MFNNKCEPKGCHKGDVLQPTSYSNILFFSSIFLIFVRKQSLNENSSTCKMHTNKQHNLPHDYMDHITAVTFYSPEEYTFLQIFQMVLTEPASTSAKPPNGGSITMTNFSLATNDSNVFSFTSTPKKK